jgi:actin-related protein 8
VAPFVFTGFQPLSTINGKNVASAFGKSEHQSWWTRRADDCTWEAQRHWKKAVMLGGDSPALLASSTLAPQPNNNHHHNQSSSSSSTNEPLDHTTANGTHPAYKLHLQPPSFYQTNPVDPAQRTIVIHPGSRTVLIGRACDPVPISIPNVVARRRVPSKGKQPANGLFRDMEPTPTPEAEATFTSKINAIRTELRSRMRAIKLRGITNGQGIAANHNAENITPLTLSEDQDPLGTVWPNVSGPDSKDIYIGEDALLIPEPEKFHYAVRWPILRGQLNSSVQSGYASKAEILADIEAVWLYALSTHLGIKEQDLKVRPPLYFFFVSLFLSHLLALIFLEHLDICRNTRPSLSFLISMTMSTCGRWWT